MINRFFILILAVGLGACGQPSTDRPNIIVIMADDHGRWASEVYGNQHLSTPNMMWLSQQGVHFTQAYSVSTVCSPVRASFFTGKMPSQHGVHDFLSESEQFDHGWLQDEVFLSTTLQSSGYATGLVGKWHATTNSALVQRGFDYWFSYDVNPEGWQNQYLHQGLVHFSEQGKPAPYQGFQTEVLVDKAMQFVSDAQDQPFFLFLGLVDTHAPFESQPQQLVSALQRKPLGEDINYQPSALPARGTANRIPEDHLSQLSQYYAGVEYMDVQIGRLLDHLRASDLLHNTIIIYTSDHGHMNGQHGLYGKGNATRPQNFYQETILVPLSITWPAQVQPGITLHQQVATTDLYPTLLDAAGVKADNALRQKSGPGHLGQRPL